MDGNINQDNCKKNGISRAVLSCILPDNPLKPNKIQGIC